MKYILFTLMALFSSVAFAEIGTTTWDLTLPTTRSDGDPLPLAEIAEVVIYDQCSTTPVELVRVPTNSTVVQDVDYLEGVQYSHCFSVVDTSGDEGIRSAAYNFTVDLIAQPGAGNINSITITCTTQKCRVVVN